MYLGVDVGGSKTLAAVLDDNGTIVESSKIATPQNYDSFLEEIAKFLDGFSNHDFRAAGVGIPATHLDRANGIGISFGNLTWKNVPVQADIEKIAHCPVVVENDAKLASLSEAMLLKQYSKVLYVTISTGIGYGLTVNQHIDSNIGDGGGALLLTEYKGKLVPWESFASGRAIYERYGKKAADITDPTVWRRIAHDLSRGFNELIAITEPDVIVVGGGVGTYFERLAAPLEAELQAFSNPLVKIPPFVKAQRPEEAVVYGCYDLAKATYGNN